MKAFVLSVVAIGVAMAMATTASGARHSVSMADVVFLLLKCLPYAVFGGVGALVLAADVRSQWLGVVLAGVVLVALDISVYVSVFYYPGSSTDPIALGITPLVQAFGVLPMMFAIGSLVYWAVTKMKR